MGAQLQTSTSRKAGRGYRPMAEINVTPFVDVMLVLLIVFMVAAPLLTAGVPIDLPDSEAKALSQEDNTPLEVSLEPDGTIYVGDTEVKRSRLIQILGVKANNDPDKRIYIRADKSMDYGKVMDVLGSINKAGFQKVALISNSSQ
ncbi:MAG: protein TolR [Alphaproteobacteria bacterium]|nr:protein TolR [Alphaproteobacteria bacterium]